MAEEKASQPNTPPWRSSNRPTAPPTDIWFSDTFSALLTADWEVEPDQGKYDYRGTLLCNFNGYGIEQARGTDADGTWRLFDK